MKKALVLCGDVWHSAEVVKKGFKALDEKNVQFDFVEDAKDILTEDYIGQYDLIINCKSNNLTSGNSAEWFEAGVTEVGPAEFKAFIEKGGAFISLHAGNTYSSENCPEMAKLIGNEFVTHPARCSVTVTPIKNHPVTNGVNTFTIRDEHYEIRLISDDSDLLLKSESATGGTQTAGYVREIGSGRLCVLTPGHILSVWEHPEFKKLLSNAIKWTLKEI